MGNQLFVFALLFAVRERNGFDFFLPHSGEAIWGCFNLDVPSHGPPCPNEFWEEHGTCNYDERVFDQPDATMYHGYFQSYRYFDDCKGALVRHLRFTFDVSARAEAMLFALRRKFRRPLASVHVRRGDYVQVETDDAWGNLFKDGYYSRAVAEIGRDVTYLVFSDDIPWCRQFLELDDAVFVDVDHGTALCMMSRCDVNVVANSSFSWWGAYLNPTADVYAPATWFRALPPPNDRQEDIVPPIWRSIPTFVGARPSGQL